MKVRFTTEAAGTLEAQVQYIREQHAPAAAERLHQRVVSFLEKHVSRLPRAGRRMERDGLEIWEMWVPRTKLILWYEIREDHVLVVSVWHAARDRSATTTET